MSPDRQRGRAEPVEVIGVCETSAADSAVGEPVLRVDEKMPSERARRTEGPPTHWAHVALAVAHHACVLLNTQQKWDEKHEKRRKITGIIRLLKFLSHPERKHCGFF